LGATVCRSFRFSGTSSTRTGAPCCGGGGVVCSWGSLGGEVIWKLTCSWLIRPVFSRTVMWSSTVSLVVSASSRTMLFRVVARILAIVGKMPPCAMRMRVTAVDSNSLPELPSAVATKFCCCGDGSFGRVMPRSVETLRQPASSRPCPTSRCSATSIIAGDLLRSMIICPSGCSHSPAARTFTTKSRSASVSGPYWVLAMMRSWPEAAFSTPSMLG
jgi:hypothetical protein